VKPPTVLIVAPHPDDETLGCGGTFAKRIEAGFNVVVVVMTDGGNLFRLSPLRIEKDPTPQETSELRKNETRRSVQMLGGGRAEVRFFDYEDGRLAEFAGEAGSKLAKLMREAKPDEIWVTSEYEEHPDHIAACAVVRSARAQSGCCARLLRYITILRPGLALTEILDPRIQEDISRQLPLKRKAISQFESHLKVMAKGQKVPFFRTADAWLGEEETFFVDP
jgi:LmbE family N-acetylglucosaminyl deacetylase